MSEVIKIDYTNWRGERSVRRVRPITIFFSSSAYHPNKQWLLEAMDLDKKEIRSFAMIDIHHWVPECGRTDEVTELPCSNPSEFPGHFCNYCRDFLRICEEHDKGLDKL